MAPWCHALVEGDVEHLLCELCILCVVESWSFFGFGCLFESFLFLSFFFFLVVLLRKKDRVE
jgi:hypothetical protein